MLKGLRRTGAAVTVLLGAGVLSASMALLSGLAYQVVAGDPTAHLVAWSLGALLTGLVVFGVAGVLWDDEVEPGKPAQPPAPASGSAPGAAAEGSAGTPDTAAAPAAAAAATGESDWYGILVFVLVLLGLLVGGPFGIAGYESLTDRPAPVSVPR
ncbi:hypothetical protein ACFFSH_02740 [Streptomyces filamentosus]|uniref:Uncharacterized protein n=1 Tax=Streptomyces filamentosus TaxID=67294 RepID=A0A919BP43_STRFL|nr:hypothetical protein [Streptomyces filamentosus]GHG02269.1 hypothetical protein GCM10017667_37490 [Streptomyces filamentosus]